MFDKQTEIAICEYYWTKLSTGYYPSYKETGAHFGCSDGLVQNLLKKHKYNHRTQVETRDKRPCKPINQPNGPAPLCKCGCDTPVKWISKDQKWQKYAPGHYLGMARKNAQPFFGKTRPLLVRAKINRKEREKRGENPTHPLFEEGGRDILQDLYVSQNHTIKEIAKMLITGSKTVAKAMEYHGIPQRTLSESLLLRGSVSGPNNPAWKGGIAKWAYAPDWKRLCKQIKDRDKWTCQLCGEQRKRWGHKLHVHHIDEDKTNNDPCNLISLCSACHAPIHGKEEKRAMLVEIATKNTSG